jgi:H/ACA ribonucleoprotein complex subunit 4
VDKIKQKTQTQQGDNSKRAVHILHENSRVEKTSEIMPHRQPTVDELIHSGVVNLNKPMGPTSHQVSSWVKNIFGMDKVGHGGTLDPRVTGVLPLAFGKTTRLLNILSTASKEYVGVMRLHGDVPSKEVQRISKKFIGQIYQLPPVRSAVKRQLRVRTIYFLNIYEQKRRDVLFDVHCQAGTYIRSLVNDIGIVLTVGAHMQELRRTRSGPFKEDTSVNLHDLKDAWVYWTDEKDDRLLRKCIMPLEVLIQDLPKIVIFDSAVDAVCHGADLAVPGIIQFEDLRKPGELVAIISRKGKGVALGETVVTTEELLKEKSGIAIKTNKVLMDPGTYQKGWKSKTD